MARYGKNTQASRRSLQRLVAKYAYAIAVKPTTKDGQELSMRMEQPKIALSDHQKTQRAELLKHYDTLQAWREQELPKVMAAKRERGDNSPLNTKDLAHAWEDEGVRAAIAVLSPESYGKLDDATKQVKAGGQLLGASALKYAALSRLYHQTDYANNGKAQHVVKMAAQAKADGKPMVIFAASAQAAQMLRNQLAKEGHRVGYIDGTLGPAEKDKERLRFSPVAGEDAETDILVTTDAAQTGLNLQRGKVLVHYDIPLTQKAWDQRSARIYRRGQTDDVDVHTLVADAPEDAIALARMQRKGSDSELFQGADATQGHAELLDDTGLAAAIAEFMQEDDPG
jgi:SNF2 family DNA or RNA helicase